MKRQIEITEEQRALLLDLVDERIARCRKWERAAEEDLEATGDPGEREDLEDAMRRWEYREQEAREIRTLLEMVCRS